MVEQNERRNLDPDEFEELQFEVNTDYIGISFKQGKKKTLPSCLRPYYLCFL